MTYANTLADDMKGWLMPTAAQVREQILSLLLAWGIAPSQAQTSAEVMVDTDLSGVDSHGLSMLMDYDTSRRNGRLNLQARPHVVRQAGATALIDADAGLGHTPAVMGMRIAIDAARAHGVGVACVRNSHHFGAAGYYVRLASAEGMIGLCTSSTRTINTVPTGARVPVLGTNPIAFAAPARRNPPFVLDMATSSAASNKVKVYELRADPLPAGWVVDEHAASVTDAAQAMDILFKRPKEIGGGLTPLGGSREMSSHKGHGLAMMVHILAGTLSGASFSPVRIKTQRTQDPDNLGHFFCAIDPAAFGSAETFGDDMDVLLDTLRATPPATEASPVLVHGDLEAAARERRSRQGIPVPPALADHLRRLCAASQVPFLFK
ncbi:Ldh family oxidoreductase [Bordetella holmesii]|uniref:Malate/L-lactate dehydrogenase n=2 Tax=Bordetella holmesii TaxID=35814 RepID=A0A158M747_9BORD|nr:Ldh family oxidoreductase [Bordetella holmesii]AHV94502.1 malate/L-lactate dehydrogenase family protein [Bordetella holmesii ATCC 51541]AIT28511.1 malate/L-lactate dehydrogenase family protein [Bordetella holmesii 44057]EWM41299.1 malate/L-lactate dehydrogenase family protein [Bordetella holmesii 35009]EWM41922.1 malate/L-lactate dehydrogenase family protein [Bordetella holmesii 41130]EWM45192.1 malate/L-lactate dehydrogenase family protein [Bordetella holmesii 70147]